MKIRESIEISDKLRPNQFSDSDKIRWLDELDGRIKKEIIDTHEGADSTVFSGYDENVDSETVLLVPAPYADMYVHYLLSKIDYNNAEYTRYNNSLAMFDSIYTEYSAYYNRNHMPIQKNRITL